MDIPQRIVLPRASLKFDLANSTAHIDLDCFVFHIR